MAIRARGAVPAEMVDARRVLPAGMGRQTRRVVPAGMGRQAGRVVPAGMAQTGGPAVEAERRAALVGRDVGSLGVDRVTAISTG